MFIVCNFTLWHTVEKRDDLFQIDLYFPQADTFFKSG